VCVCICVYLCGGKVLTIALNNAPGLPVVYVYYMQCGHTSMKS